MPLRDEERAMQQVAGMLAQKCPAQFPVERRCAVGRRDQKVAVGRPEITSRPRIVQALVWLYRVLLVEPVGRRARADRLAGLSDRILGDIGIRRADVHAATWGAVALRAVVPAHPADRPLVVCGRPGYPLTLVRMSEAA
jgi:hypothetical protein